MTSKTKEPFKWWLKTIGQGLATTAIAFAPDILKLFPEHTLLFKLALPIGAFLKFTFGEKSMRKEYQRNELPSGLSKMMDKIPDKITGARKPKYPM